MRALLALLLAGTLAAPALAGHCRTRHARGGGFYRYHHFQRYHAPRLYAQPYAYGYYPAHQGCAPAYYDPCGYRYFRPVLRIAPAYTRAFTVLTIDDEAFSRAAGPAHDGLPQPRTEPVGGRFLVDTD